MNAQILLAFQIAEKIQGRLAADIMNGKPDRFIGEIREDISIQEIVDSIAGEGSYAAVPVPTDYRKPEKAFGLKAILDVTEHTFLLAGSYRVKSGVEALAVLNFSVQSVDVDEQAVYDAADRTDRELVKPVKKYTWWLGAQLKHFTLSDISSALEGADRFLGLDNVTAAVILSGTDQEIRIGEEVSFLSDIGKADKGLTFQIDLAFSDGFLKDVLKFPETCRISGYIPSDQKRAIKLSGHGTELVFLQFLSVTDIDITLEKDKGENTFAFSAGGDLKLNFQEMQIPKIRVKLSFEENSMGKRVLLQGRVVEPVKNPLGIPNTELKQMVFTAISESYSTGTAMSRTEQFYFQGRVAIAGIEIAAMIYFAQRKPAVVEMTVGGEQKLSISGLVKKYFNFEWPDILDIQLYNGRIWYCRQDVDLGQAVYRQGFHAQLDTKIFFLPECTLSIDINNDTNELTAGARINNATEFAFVKLYTEQQGKEYGPEISIHVKKDETEFKVSSIVNFFSEKIMGVVIAVKKNGMEGTLEFPPGLPISGSVSFSVDENGLSLGECGIGELPWMDFDLPKMDFGSGKCKIEVISGIQFKAVPEVKSKTFILNNNELRAEFDLIIRIKSETSFSDDGGDDFVMLTFDDLSLTADGSYHDFSFETFLELLKKNIFNLVQAMGERIINGQVFGDDKLTEENMKNIAKVLTIAGVRWGINELVSYLICKGLKKLLADAFAAALTSIQENLWEGLGFSLMLGGILGSIGSDGTYTAGKKAPVENEENPEKNPQTPAAPTVFFQDEKLMIQWNACEGAEGYNPIVFRRLSGQEQEEQGINLMIEGSSDTVCEIACSDEESLYLASYGFEYWVKIYAWNSEGAALGKETGIYLLKRPTHLVIRYQCEKKRLCLTWDSVEKAEQYEVERLWHEQGETKREIATYESDIGEVVYGDQEPGQKIEVLVRGKIQNVIGPAVGSGEFYLYDLKPPEKIEGYSTDAGITLEWTKVPFADRYRVSCLDDAGREIMASVCSETQTVIGLAKLKEDVCYKMRIQPMTEDIEGWLSEEVRVLWRTLPVPEIQELVCGEDGVLTVSLLADNVRYRQMVYPDGRTVVLDEQFVSCEWCIIDEDAQVRLVERARQGNWSQAISVKPVNAPEAVQAVIKEDTLHVQWKETEDEYFYGIEIVAEEYRLVEEMLTGTSWQADISRIPPDELVRVCLYAIDSADTRRRSVSVEIACRRDGKGL